MTIEDIKARLDEIKARHQAATEGPWVFDWPDPDEWIESPFAIAKEEWRADITQPENGEFIAHARSDVPALEAALRAVVRECTVMDIERVHSPSVERHAVACRILAAIAAELEGSDHE